jgi:hypothetical protein
LAVVVHIIIRHLRTEVGPGDVLTLDEDTRTLKWRMVR